MSSLQTSLKFPKEFPKDLLIFLCNNSRRVSFLLSFPCLTFLYFVLPLFSSTWLSPLLSFISSSLPLLLPFYLSTFSSFQPHSREFAISPWPMKYANKVFCLTYQIRIDIQHAFLTGALVLCCFGCLTVDSWCFGLSRMYQRPTAVASTKQWSLSESNQPGLMLEKWTAWINQRSTEVNF